MIPRTEILHIVNIIASPTEVCRELNTTPRWRAPFLLMLLSTILVGWCMIPAMMEPMRKIFISSFGERAAEGALQGVMKSMLVMQLLLEPVLTFVRWTVFAGILYLLSLAFAKDQEGMFKKLFSLVAYSEVIFVLMSVLTVLIIYSKGIAGIQGIDDLTIFKGVDYLFGEGRSNNTFVTILGNVNPFSVWYVITVAFGVSVFMELHKSRAIALASIGWMLWSLASVLQSIATENLLGLIM